MEDDDNTGSSRLARITTKRGDQGFASLSGAARLRKDDLSFEVLGDLDELNSYLGVAKKSSARDLKIDWVQGIVLDICSMVARSPTSPRYKDHKLQIRLEELEAAETQLLSTTVIPRTFVKPGGNIEAAHYDYARTLCRRAERRLVKLAAERDRPDLEAGYRFLNRLSDYLFICARNLEPEAG